MWHNTIYIYFLYLYFRTFFKFKIRILLITTHTFHIIYLFVYLYMYRRKCTNKNVNLHVKFLKDKTRSSWRIIIIVCCCLSRSVSFGDTKKRKGIYCAAEAQPARANGVAVRASLILIYLFRFQTENRLRKVYMGSTIIRRAIAQWDVECRVEISLDRGPARAPAVYRLGFCEYIMHIANKHTQQHLIYVNIMRKEGKLTRIRLR